MPEQIHVMIVEDESIVAMDLAAGLEHDGYVVTGIADNYEEAVKMFAEQPVDILLMDIHIQGDKDGVDTATALMSTRQVPLIYLTAFTDAVTIERVKHTNPSAFLTKPYSIDNVRIAIDLALHHFAEAKPATGKLLSMPASTEKRPDKEQFLQLKEYIFIKQNYRFVKFRLSEVLYAEADNNYVNIHTLNQKFALRLSLSDLLDRLHFSRLIRIHRSYAVNLDAISSFDDQLIRIGQHEIPIGRNYRQDFMNQFNLR
ncbi:MAG TPA: LytTR family transcriptional regulator DNA-binding domain-containing protein [Chitinophagaceae bacterium]|jgi:DNA-binding LytR/AlgR family response regulator|nr:LytTR family transcriptional regulator DNA-binding domain-containing protein [Chitinophagaceae bacterium]